MSKLKQLEVKKLLKELDFIESDFNYKNEIVFESDINFIKSVNDLLDKHPMLKDVIDKRIIYPNAWFVYGCGKPEDLGYFYKVTK